jgi:hypothetical protein
VCTRGSEPAEGRASAQKDLHPLVKEITPTASKLHPTLLNLHRHSEYYTHQKLKISIFQFIHENLTQLEIV